MSRDRQRAAGRWFEVRGALSLRTRGVLGATTWVLFFAVWEIASTTGLANPLLLPAPHTVIVTIVDLFVSRGFTYDVALSLWRIFVSFAIASVVSIVLGVLMGIFTSVEAAINPFVSAWRYLPAPSFIPILLMWFGTGELPKLALLFIGVVFFLITLIMDHTKTVKQELIETSLTLGGSRRDVVFTVVLPAVYPSIVVAMRQMLAVSWTYLVIAEIVASTDGIGAMMMRARRFLHTDEIMAGIVVIGVLGLLSDMAFRAFYRWQFPYLTANAGSK